MYEVVVREGFAADDSNATQPLVVTIGGGITGLAAAAPAV